MRLKLFNRDAAIPPLPVSNGPGSPSDVAPLGKLGDHLDGAKLPIEERREAREDRWAALEDLKALSGDPDQLEASDLDASEDFTITASEDGTVVMTTPMESRETEIVFSDDTDSFEDLIAQAKARAEATRDAVDALKALSGDPEKLEASDLDASEDFTITASETGTVVITTPKASHKTEIVYAEDTDSFVDWADKVRATLEEWRPFDAFDPETELEATAFDWTLRDRLADLRGASDPETTASEAALVSWMDSAPELSAEDFTGAGQTIVIIDDGYSLAYDQSATVFEYDFAGWRNDASAQTAGSASHGSWVAQTAIDAASGVEIVHLKVFSDYGGTAQLRDVEEALDFVIATAGAFDIAAVNLSLGYGNATDETYSILSDEFAALDDLGIFSIVAAGNAGETYGDGVNVLAADPNVIGVSAVDEAGAFAAFSQTSESLTDIAALGVDVPVETVSGTQYEVSGTSFAAPEIAGIAARLQEAALATIGAPLTDEEFLEILRASGDAVVDAPEADGYYVADGDAAVEYFLANTDAYGGMMIA